MLNKRDFTEAIKEFKIVRDIADETESDKMRMHGYNMLGCCY